MTLRHFQIFTKVCEKMNMTAAAKALFISQSAVSQAIAELEEHYGVKLFERYSNRLYMTDAGGYLMSHAYHMLDYSKQIEQAMFEKKSCNDINIGATLTVGAYFLPPIVALFRQTNPLTHIRIHTHNTHEIEQMLLIAELDLAVVEGSVQSSDILKYPLIDDEMVFIYNANSSVFPIDNKNELTDIKLLNGVPLLMRENGSGSRRQIEQVLQENGVEYHIAGVFNSIEGIKRAAYYGLGVGIISRRAITEDENLKYFTVREMHITRTFSLIYHKNKHINYELSHFMDYLKKVLLLQRNQSC